MQKTIKASCKEAAEIHSEQEITLRAPQIKLMGVLSMENYEGVTTTGTLTGDFNIRQDDITVEKISLRQHCHEKSGGSELSGRPQGG